MAELKTCPKCAAELPENAPAGICPKCLMRAGLASEQDGGSSPELKPTTLASGFVPPEPEELAKHFPQLEISELLGRGGMGAVYKAKQRGLDRLVALKILPPEVSSDPAFAERFTREARALAKLTHANIVTVHDFGQADGLFYFLMEYVDGVNLRQAIHAGDMTPQEALAIVPQICEALQFAHDEGIVHRDIKPENILIDKRGRVKIADFGLAKLLGQDASDHSLTATHQVMGTLRYMAPEQMQGSRAVDHRADIYSLGVVFYELLTGELPMGKFAPPSKRVQVDVRLDEVVLRALEQNPEQRYQHASEVKSDVENITRHDDPDSASSGTSERSQPPDRGDGPPNELLTTLLPFLLATLATSVVLKMVVDPQLRSPLFFVTLFGTFFATRALIRRLVAAYHARNEKSGTGSVSLAEFGTPVTQIRFMVNDSANVVPQANFHFSALGYRLIEQRADVCVFQRGGRWAGLWEFDIREIATRLTVRTAPAGEGQQWVSCDWSVRTLGAWVTKRDTRQLEAEGRGLETLLGGRAHPDGEKTGTGSVPSPIRERSASAWSVFEIVTAAAVAVTFVIAAVKGIFELAQRPSPLDVVAVPVAALAASAAGVLLVVHQFRRPIGSRAALPELFIAILAACAGSLPWTWAFGNIAGWNFWQGAVFASLNFVLALFLLVVGNSRLRTRAIVTLLVGSIGFGLVMWFNVGPVSVIGGDGLFQGNITRKPGLPGMFIAAALGLLAMIAGTLQLRNRMNTEDNAETSPLPEPSNEPRLCRLALWGAILTVLSVLAFLGFLFVGTVVFSHLFVEHYGSTNIPPLGVSIAEWLLVTVSGLAAIGAPLCGAAAISQIEKSNGQLYGLPLARGCVLCAPLLVLGGITGTLTQYTCIEVWTNWPGPAADLMADTPPAGPPGHYFMVLDAIAALVVCFFVGRAMWRGITSRSGMSAKKETSDEM